MWFYHWSEAINELLKKFGFGLATFVLLFSLEVPRLCTMPQNYVKHLGRN